MKTPPIPVMRVSHFDGEVTITVPPKLAKDIASLWGHAHAIDPLLGATRPDWHLDMVALLLHAAAAAEQLDTAGQSVDVPLVAPARPRLEVVVP